MPKVKDLLDILKNDFDPDDIIAYSLWTEKDIEILNEQENRNRLLQDKHEIYLQPEEIEQILECMQDQSDPDQGLNNDSMFSAYIDIIGDREEVDEEEEIGVF